MNDLAAMAALPTDRIPEFLTYVRQRLASKRSIEIDRLDSLAAASLGLERRGLSHAYDIAYWFVGQFAPEHDAENDEPADIADDLIELGHLPKTEREKVIQLLVGLKSVIQQDLALELRKTAVVGKCFPKFLAAETAVTFHAVFEKEMKFGEEVDKYEPNCIGVVPVVSVRISTDEKDTAPIAFEFDVSRLQQFQDTLAGALQELEAATKHLNLKE